jgi:uncharacterized protein YdeI (YjbR/CyaY-like superfamily)
MQILRINQLQELKAWLELNYNSKETIWLEFPKKTAGADYAWSEIVDVLLAYSWIDSVTRKVDEDYTSIRISPRNPKSNWSRINKDKIARLVTENLMHNNGIAMVELAKKSGTWNALDDVENLILPKELEEYLVSNKLSKRWNAKGHSFKRGFLETLLNTKRPETRQKKIEDLEL